MILKVANAIIEAIQQIREKGDDKTISLPSVSVLLPKMKYDGSLIKAGTALNFDGKVMRAASDLWDTELNNPENAPTLWNEIHYKNGIRWIKEGESISATEPFKLNELGYFGNDDTLHKCKIDGCVWTPQAYPSAWEVVE